jgi:hypothetical protein
MSIAKIQTYNTTQHNVNIHWYLPDPPLIPLLARYPGTVPYLFGFWIPIKSAEKKHPLAPDD